MCRHCERLVEDIEHKEIIHKFFEITATKLSKLHKKTIHPDSISVIFELNLPDIRTEFLYKVLNEIDK